MIRLGKACSCRSYSSWVLRAILALASRLLASRRDPVGHTLFFIVEAAAAMEQRLRVCLAQQSLEPKWLHILVCMYVCGIYTIIYIHIRGCGCDFETPPSTKTLRLAILHWPASQKPSQRLCDQLSSARKT